MCERDALEVEVHVIEINFNIEGNPHFTFVLFYWTVYICTDYLRYILLSFCQLCDSGSALRHGAVRDLRRPWHFNILSSVRGTVRLYCTF